MQTLIRPFAYIARRGRLEARIGSEWAHLPVERAIDLLADLRLMGSPVAVGRVEALELAIEDMRQAQHAR